MRLTIVFWSLMTLLVSDVAYAQWGTGMWGGNQGCAYPQQVGPGAIDQDDAIQDLKERKRRLEEKLSRQEKKLRRLKVRETDAMNGIRGTLSGEASKTVIQHIQQKKDRNHYNNCEMRTGKARTTSMTEGQGRWPAGVMPEDEPDIPLQQAPPIIEDTVANPPAQAPTQTQTYTQQPQDDYGGGWDNIGQGNPDGSARYNGEPIPNRTFCEYGMDENGQAGYRNWWARYVLDGGEVDSAICTSPRRELIKQNSRKDYRDCEDGIVDLIEVEIDRAELLDGYDGINNLEREIRMIDRDIDETRDRLEDEYYDDVTQGECISCLSHRRNYRTPSTLETVGNIGISILGGYFAYKNMNHAIDTSAQLGWPTSPYMAASAGMPLLMNGIYGALGGGLGQGAYGCAGGSPMGGAFGYPGMYGSPYGGMMMGGGMGGMMGGYPMGGGMMGGYPMGTMMGGYPMGGGMMGGYPMGGMMVGGGLMMGGYPMGGMMMSGGMMVGGGMPMGGYPMGGMPMGGYPMGGMMGGYPMGGMMGGYPMGGMMGGYPMGGMMGGYPMGGGMMGGMPMGGGMMGGMPMGGGMMGGMPMGGGMMGGGLGMGGLQLQQQMMQQYMSGMQTYMQYQQQQQADYMMRQQTVTQLQSELYRIQMQIQQISAGGLGGGYSVLPYPSTGGAGGGGTPAPGTSQGR